MKNLYFLTLLLSLLIIGCTPDNGDGVLIEGTTPPSVVEGDCLSISSVEEFRWLCYYGQTVNGKRYSKISINSDINMGEYSDDALPSINLKDGTEVNGNGKTIIGVKMNGDASSIFGDVDNLDIHDIAFSNCSVNTSLQTGAAILVGAASKGLSVSNVSFDNCSVVAPCKIGLVAGVLCEGTFDITDVTANGGVVETAFESGYSGLAGGLVGYIAKDKEGKTTSSTTFTNCNISTTIKAYMENMNNYYGKMVGQLGGYTGDEKLYFVNCNGADATLVPLSDKGKKYAESARLGYCEEHKAGFSRAVLTSATDCLLGGERYSRGEVYFDGERFVATWDGVRTTSILTDTEGGATRYLIYSPYDLAKVQGQSFEEDKQLIFMADVDMGGNVIKPFKRVDYLDGGGHSLHNFKVDITHDASKNYGAGFIICTSSKPTIHKNITFVGADISCKHDKSIAPLDYGDTNDGGAGNAYAGVLVSRVLKSNEPYTVANVHIKDSKVRGVCKVGGLVGNMTNSGTGAITIDGCSVDNTVVENYDPKVVNYYKIEGTSSGMVIDGLQWWYTAGECGGLIGFVSAKSVTISNCSVTNTQINCTGQEDKDVVANIWDESKWTANTYKSGVSIKGNATTTIAGRHINQFIGNIRSQRTETQQKNGTGEYTTTISNYTVSGNSYNGVAAESTNEYNHNYASGKYCEVVGCAYYTGVDVNMIINIHVSHCAGTLNFNAVGASTTTLTEAIGSGNNMSWCGGNSKNVSLGLFGNNGTSYYPPAPTE